MKRRLSLGLAVLVVACLAFLVHAATHRERLDFEFDLTPGSELTVVGINGNITYTPWNGREIVVTAHKDVWALFDGWAKSLADQVEIVVTESPNGVTIETIPGFGRFFTQRSVTFDIKVPYEWHGIVTLRTSNGSIRADEIHGDVELRTSNGSIVVDGHVGRLVADTTNGRIELRDVDSNVYARTSNGRFTVERSRLRGDGLLRTSNGSMRVHAALYDQADYEVRTSNGSMELTFIEPVDVELELKTSNGSIRMQNTSILTSQVSKNELKGRIGSGSARLYGRTSNGSITVAVD